jgi:hypothetical protein
MPPHLRLAPFTAVVFSRQVAVLAGAAVVLIVIGCMSLHDSINHEDGTFSQEFTTSLSPGAEIEIYYPVPYTATPHLVLDDGHGDCILTDQQATHFRIRNRSQQYVRTVTWKARGIRVPPGIVVPLPQGPPPQGPPPQGPPRVPMFPPQPPQQELPPPAPVPAPQPGPGPAHLGQPS